MKLLAILAAVFGGDPPTVDRVEVQHVLRSDGETQFTQVITYRWFDKRWPGDRPSGYVVAQWEMVKNQVSSSRHGSFWEIAYRDRHGRRRSWRTRHLVRSWSKIDHERQNLDVYPSSMRFPYRNVGELGAVCDSP